MAKISKVKMLESIIMNHEALQKRISLSMDNLLKVRFCHKVLMFLS